MDNDPLDTSLDETWLRDVGFKWHQLERQPDKHWLLWLGRAMNDGITAFEDVGIELAPSLSDGKWFCWLRSDLAHRYSRFIHIRMISTRQELVAIIEGLTGHRFIAENNLGGSMLTHDEAADWRRRMDRLDVKIAGGWNTWHDSEKDGDRGRPLHDHMRSAIDAGKAK